MELLKDSSASVKPIPLLVCPYCRESIPRLFLIPFKGRMNVIVKCPCLKPYSEVNLHTFMKDLGDVQAEDHQCSSHFNKSEKYSYKDDKWLCDECLKGLDGFEGGGSELFEQKPGLINCRKHWKPFSMHCWKCDVDFCSDCEFIHTVHKHNLIPPIHFEESKRNYFDEAISFNRQLTNSLIERLSQSHLPSKMKEDLLSACDDNESINKDLELLYHILCKTTIYIHTEDIIEKNLSIEEDCLQLTNYLRTHFVLKQRKTNECILNYSTQNIVPGNIIQLKDGRLATTHVKVIEIWESLACLSPIPLIGHSERISCLIQLKDERLVSASYDKTIKIWNIFTNECIATLMGHCNIVSCIIELKGGRLASGSFDNRVKIWNTSPIKFCSTLYKKSLSGLSSKTVLCLAQCKEGKLASGYSDYIIQIWSPQGIWLTTLTGHQGEVSCLLALNDGRLASGSEDKTIKLWDTAKAQCLHTWIGHDGSLNQMVLLNDSLMASSCFENTIRIWDTAKNKRILTLRNSLAILARLCKLNNGKLLTFYSYTSEIIRIWDI